MNLLKCVEYTKQAEHETRAERVKPAECVKPVERIERAARAARAARTTRVERIVLCVRGFNVVLEADWSRVFKPGESAPLAYGMQIKKGETVCEVGLGSGINAIVAARLGAAKVCGTEIVRPAFESACRNARLNGIASLVDFRLGCFLEPFRGKSFDVVFADMPWGPTPPRGEAEALGLNKEMVAALCGGPIGYEATITYLDQAAEHLNPGGRIYFTLGEITRVNEALDIVAQRFHVREVYSALTRVRGNEAYKEFLESHGAHLTIDDQGVMRFRTHVYEATPRK